MYEVYLRRSAQKALEQLAKGNRTAHDQIISAIEGLRSDPRPPGCKALRARDDYRIRVRDWRVLYFIDDAQHVVTVTAVVAREEAY